MRTAITTALALALLATPCAWAQEFSPPDAPPEVTSNVPAEPSHQPPPSAPPVRPVATRQSAFSIPFSVDPATDPSNAPVEVQLLVSVDQGKNWSIYLKQRPDVKRFNFRASGDGEYWFASRTIDAQQRSRPEGQFNAELKVVVDSQPPKFDLVANVGPSGEIKTSWNIFDPNLAPESFKLEYRAASASSWTPLAIAPASEILPRSTLKGEQTFNPQTTSLVVDVRGEVRDDAGNPTVTSKRVFLPRVARRPAESGAEGLLSGLSGMMKSPFSVPESTTAPPDPFAARRPAPLDSAAAAKPPSTDAPPAMPARPPLPSQAWPPSNAAPAKPAVAEAPAPPRSEIPPPVAGRFVSNSSQSESPAQIEPPPGEKPSYTSARQFNLDYDTELVGPSGVAAVELWGTRDGGRTWTKWALDEDKQSPLRVDVDADGLFGFRVVVESGIGLAGPRPHSGDAADIWVGIDTAKPQAQLTSAIFGTGEFVGQLDIRWEAADDNLKERPITLSFAEQTEGPWTTIAAGLPNNGRYLWNADPRLPRQIHLRLEARDEAGNVGEHILGEPISTAGLSPKGKIRGIRPLDEAPSGAALQRVVR